MISVRISASPMIVLSETYTEYSNSVAGRSRRGGISNQLHNIQKADCEGFLSQRCYDVLGIRDGAGPFLKYALTACSIKLNADRPCNAHVAITVHKRSQLLRPLMLRVP